MKKLLPYSCILSGLSLGAVLLLAVAPVRVFADFGGAVQPPIINGDILSVPGVGQFQMVEPMTEYELESGKFKAKGSFQYNGILNNTANLLLEEIEFEPDPTVVFTLTWDNITPVAQTYSFNLTVPALLNVSPNQRYGAITTQVIDKGMDGAYVVAPAGQSVYNALIDGTVVRTMQSDPFSVVAPPMGVNNNLQTFGWELNNLPVNQSIGITLNFTLSPGDTASFLARFDVVVIPEPSTLSLLALGGLALVLRRRF